jgi:hypothetical protein
MVSNEDMLGLRDRKLVGVEGIDEVPPMDELDNPGYASLYRVPRAIGEECNA